MYRQGIGSSAQWPEEKNLSAVAFVSLSTVLTVVFTFVLSTLLLMAGVPLNGVIFLAALLLAILFSAAVSGGGLKQYLPKGIVVTLGVALLSPVVAGFIIDYSYDGIIYHQEIIALLCDGWNPFKDAVPHGSDGPITSLWAIHYAKGVEMTQAAVVAFTGKIESGKGVNFILTFGTAMAVYDLLRRQCEGFSRKRSVFICLAVIANPVIWEQILTYYIDFYKYLYLLLMLTGIAEMASGRNPYRRYGYILVAVSVVMSVASKFNFFFEAALWGCAAVVWALLTKRFELMRRLLAVGGGAFVLGIALTWHPYVTNWLAAGHPLYPLMGDGAIDIMSENTTEMFRDYDRITNFFRSLLIPAFGPYCDQRNSGFSVLMPWILLLTAIIAWKTRRRIRGVVWYIALFALMSCFIFEQTWWPRYICQLWLVPALFVPYGLQSRRVRRLTRVCGVLMIMAGAYVFLWAWKYEFVVGSYNHLLLMESSRQPIEVLAPVGIQYRRHFAEAGVSYTVIDSLPDLNGTDRKALYYIERWEPVVVVSDRQAAAVRSSLERMHLQYHHHEYNVYEADCDI